MIRNQNYWVCLDVYGGAPSQKVIVRKKLYKWFTEIGSENSKGNFAWIFGWCAVANSYSSDACMRVHLSDYAVGKHLIRTNMPESLIWDSFHSNVCSSHVVDQWGCRVDRLHRKFFTESEFQTAFTVIDQLIISFSRMRRSFFCATNAFNALAQPMHPMHWGRNSFRTLVTYVTVISACRSDGNSLHDFQCTPHIQECSYVKSLPL